MLRSRFLWRLFAGYAVLIVVTGVIAGLLIGRRIASDTRRDIESSLRAKAVLLRGVAEEPLAAPPRSEFQREIEDLGAELAIRITIMRGDGVVIADSEQSPSRLDNHGERPEVLEARARGVGIAVRHSDSVGESMMYVAMPVDAGGDGLIGYVRTSLPLDEIRRRIAHLWSIIIGVGLIGATLALVIGYLFVRRTLRPLTDMTAAAASIAAGDQHPQLALRRQDEIGQLAHALDAISHKLRAQLDTITQDRNELRAILGSMVEGVIAVDPDETIVHINDRAAELLGAPAGDNLGKRLWEVTRVLNVCDAVSASIRSGEKRSDEVVMTVRGGDQSIEFHVSPLLDGDARRAGAVVVLHDTTEMRRLESVQRDFVANVSHELKTPLTAIRGFIETLVDDEGMSGDVRRRFLGKIQGQTQRLTALVTDLLTISRLESHVERPTKAPLDICEIARGKLAVRVQLGVPEEQGLRMGHRLADHAVMVFGDAEELGQIIDNLLDNAIQYTPSGGSIELRVTTDGDDALIEVEDTGIGIEPLHQERIFERFYREDKARSRALGGTGLGLAIVKHTALARGGRVAVESTPGNGSIFRVWIPLHGAAAHA